MLSATFQVKIDSIMNFVSYYTRIAFVNFFLNSIQRTNIRIHSAVSGRSGIGWVISPVTHFYTYVRVENQSSRCMTQSGLTCQAVCHLVSKSEIRAVNSRYKSSTLLISVSALIEVEVDSLNKFSYLKLAANYSPIVGNKHWISICFPKKSHQRV